MKYKIKIPKTKDLQFIKNYFSKNNLDISNLKINPDVIPPNFLKLYVLHELVNLNKRISVLEIGSGWSSLFLGNALNENKKKNKLNLSLLGFKKPYEMISIDNSLKFLKIAKKRLEIIKKKKIKNRWVHSEVFMSKFNGNICTFFKNLPACQPDFIYLDGPDLTNIKKNKKFKFSTQHPDSLNISGDILRIEFFLIPGTILIVDGRGGNVEFLKKNFKRSWKYIFLRKTDQHIFLLNSEPIGKKNIKLLKYYFSKN